MAYFNFTKIVPPAPNDPTVNEVTQLNNNWDHIETKLTPYVNGGSLSGLETGQEYLGAPGPRAAVWNGTARREPDDIDAAWTAWTAVPIISPRVTRPGNILKWRQNPLMRKVELRGGVLFDASSNAWTLGATFLITNDVAGGIPGTSFPVGVAMIGPTPTAIAAAPAIVAGAYVTVDKPGANTFCRIRVQYMGGPGGGNFIALDQIWWWY